MGAGLLEAIEASDVDAAKTIFDRELSGGKDPWQIHESLFPAVQAVLNPPFINPHLPKMYAIYRELAPRVEKTDIPALVRLEIVEYARRPKLKTVFSGQPTPGSATFSELEAALQGRDPAKIAWTMQSYGAQHGLAELARKLIMIGSGYLDKSLGHSISCTAFIQLEALDRTGRDISPAIAMLADYYHKGRFQAIPPLRTEPLSAEETDRQLLRAVSGGGIVNLHHTITLYAIDRVRRLLKPEEYTHCVHKWIEFLGDKKTAEIFDGSRAEVIEYPAFHDIFSTLDVRAAFAPLSAMLGSGRDRPLVGRYLIKGVCDLYDGDYNPHNLTGIGSLLWVLDRYPGTHPIAVTAVHQFLDYFFSDLKS